MGPNYEKPQVQTPDAWQEVISHDLSQKSGAALQTWWQIFDDPILNDLIEEARTSNLNVRMAVARISESRARLGMATGRQFPIADVKASAAEFKHSDNGALKQLAPPEGFNSQTMYALYADALWEVDVFGRIRRQIEASGAEYEASIEDYRDILVTLLAEVATAYVRIRSFQQRIHFARANAVAQQEVLKLTRHRYESGVGSKLDVAQARANLANTEATIPQLQLLLMATINQLNVLLGRSGAGLRATLEKHGLIPSPKEGIGIGVPADILRQRPDVREAERQLAAHTAMVGVATAELYPRFAITGYFGFETGSFSDLGGFSSGAWAIKAPIQWNIFNGERTRNWIRAREAIVKQELFHYQNTVLAAIEEVENAIVAHNQDQIRHGWLRDAVDATQEAVDLVIIQYSSGLTDFNNVLDTQRMLFEQQDQLVSCTSKVVLDLIRLYKALGGGWQISEVETRERSGSREKL